jgi:hypothetical protein
MIVLPKDEEMQAVCEACGKIRGVCKGRGREGCMGE